MSAARLLPCTDAAAIEASHVVREGGVVAFPTETFYGLGVDPWNKAAIQRLFTIKGRSTSSPILVLIRHAADLECLVKSISGEARQLMEMCWPGPLTLVFQAGASVLPDLTGGTGTIGVRYSAHPLVQMLLRRLGGPLTGTSANRSGDTPATTANAVQAVMGDDIDLILDGGVTPGGRASTVVDTTVVPVRILREGCVSRETLRTILGSIAASP